MQFHLPPLCSLQTFIGIIILLYVYLTLQSSISLHDKIVTHQNDQSTTGTGHLPSPLFRQSFLKERSTGYGHHVPMSSPPPPPLSPPPPRSFADLVASTGNLSQDFEITWGDGRGQITDDGMKLTHSLDNSSGSGFQSRNEYLFGKIDMQIKLIPGDSAGTVTTYYLSSEATHPGNHDEIDFEFLGNVTGQPYTLHTNVYCQGVGSREQQFYLWFDPTQDFHTYSILWNPQRIVFYVDGTPIREFKNMERFGIPYLNKQPMRIYSSLWNADDWATQGGKVKTDWKQAPFVASYRNFSADACVWYAGSSSCDAKLESEDVEDNGWLREGLDSRSLERLKWVQEEYRTYNYCDDKMRFNEGLPKECAKSSDGTSK